MAEKSSIDGLSVTGLSGALSVNAGLQYVGGNWETYVDVLKSFAAELPKHLANIEEAFSAEDWASYAVEAHAYKGLMATIGFDGLSAWGKRLERAAKDGETAVCRAETAGFVNALVELKEKIEKSGILPQAQSGTERVSIEEFRAILADFCAACEQSSLSKVKSLTKKISVIDIKNVLGAAIAPAEIENAAQKLEEVLSLCEFMEFDTAADILHNLNI